MREIRSLLPGHHTFIRGLGMKLSTATTDFGIKPMFCKGCASGPSGS